MSTGRSIMLGLRDSLMLLPFLLFLIMELGGGVLLILGLAGLSNLIFGTHDVFVPDTPAQSTTGKTPSSDWFINIGLVLLGLVIGSLGFVIRAAIHNFLESRFRSNK